MFDFGKIYSGWSLERLARHVVYWLLWLVFFAVLNSNYHERGFWSWIEVELMVMTVKLPFTYFVIYYLVPRYLIRKTFLPFAIGVGLLAFIGGLLINILFNYIISPFILGEPSAHYWTSKFWYKMVDLVYIASLPTILKLVQHYIQQEKRTSQIAEEKLNAELQLLKNQLQPHFLFNTLNNLYGMVLTKNEKSPEVLLRLSAMMSYMLYESDHPTISLAKEVEQLEHYIELEKIRHGERLDLIFEKSGALEEHRIVPLLLLPFVENAFKHGVEKNEEESWVRINIWVNGNRLEFMVENNLPEEVGQPPEDNLVKGGIGLENVKKRLELCYPDRYRLSLRNGNTFFVKLTLELSKAEEHEVHDRG